MEINFHQQQKSLISQTQLLPNLTPVLWSVSQGLILFSFQFQESDNCFVYPWILSFGFWSYISLLLFLQQTEPALVWNQFSLILQIKHEDLFDRL